MHHVKRCAEVLIVSWYTYVWIVCWQVPLPELKRLLPHH
jgi:hypothetical protein